MHSYPPQRAGVGLKPEHYRAILDSEPEIGFFEIHAENYMGAGGPPHRYLEAVRARYPLSIHGVALSIGAERDLDREHLQRLRALCRRYEPILFSEHLAWSSHGATYLNDLLPLPYTEQTLDRVCAHVSQVQESLGRRMLLENPATYVSFACSTIPETEFLAAIASRTGCGLLLDVNNIFVSACNLDFDASAYLDAIEPAAVAEIHLAGHAIDHYGDLTIRVDNHGDHVCGDVMALFERFILRAGPRPTLVEWDANIPSFETLAAEAGAARAAMQNVALRGGVDDAA